MPDDRRTVAEDPNPGVEHSSSRSASTGSRFAPIWQIHLGTFQLRPSLGLAAILLWIGGGTTWAQSPLPARIAMEMEMEMPLRFLAVLCALAAFCWNARVFKNVHIIATVLACIPLSLICAFAFPVFVLFGLISLFFTVALRILSSETVLFSWESLAVAVPPITFLAILTTTSSACWLLAYHCVLQPYSPRTDELNKRSRYSTTCILLLNSGIFGAHHFFLKNYARGALYFGTLGFVGMGVIYDLIRLVKGRLPDGKNQLVSCPKAPVPEQPIQKASGSSSTPGAEQLTAPKNNQGLLALGFLAAVGSLVGVGNFIDLGWPIYTALPAGIAVGILGVCVLLVLSLSFTEERRRILRVLPSRLKTLFVLRVRKSESKDYASARKAAGNQGTIDKRGSLAIWTDSEDPSFEHCHKILEQTTQVLEERMALQIKPHRSLRILLFSEVDAMKSYSRPLQEIGMNGEYVGYYTGAFHPRIVLSRQWSGLPIFDFDASLAHEYLHYLHLENNPFNQPAWLVEGLATWLAGIATPLAPFIKNGQRRLLRYLESNRQLINGAELVSVQVGGPVSPKAANHPKGAASSAYLRTFAFYIQSACLLNWLYQNHAEAVRTALFGPTARLASTKRAFIHHFGMEPDTAMDAALTEYRATAAPIKFEETPADFLERKQAVERNLYPLLKDPNVSHDTKLQVLRMLPIAAPGLDWTPLRNFHDTSRGSLEDAAALALDMLEWKDPENNGS